MGPPGVLPWSLAALALGALGGAWWARLFGRRGRERAERVRSRAVARKVSALRRVEERYRDFFEHSPMGIFRSSPAGRFLDANGNLAGMLGFATPAELVAAVTDIGGQLYLDPRERAEAFRRVLAEGIIKDFEVRLRRRDGATVWLSLNLRAVCGEIGTLDHVEGFAVNVSGRKRAEEALTRSLEAKELLLQELRHRVKNNLQVLQSLVALTGNRVTAPESVRACREISGYIRCLAVMHALLSRAPTGDRVNLADMVRDLFAAASGLYPARGAAAHFALEDVPLHLDQALPCGMLFNTLVADVFKRARPGGRPARMRVELVRLPDGRVRIEMADGGEGLVWKDGTSGADMDAGLMRSLAAQLEAELDLDCGEGTRFRLVFEPSASRDRLRAREGTQPRPM